MWVFSSPSLCSWKAAHGGREMLQRDIFSTLCKSGLISQSDRSDRTIPPTRPVERAL